MRFWLLVMHLCICLAFISKPVAAQAPPPSSSLGTDFQSWDELDALTRLSSYLDVTWIARGRFSAELPNPAVYVFGTDWNFTISKNLMITPSYYHFAFRTASGALAYGQSPILAFTPKFSRGRLIASDRNRFGGRFATDQVEPAWVYRNRPRIDRGIGPEQWKNVTFCMG